MLVNNEWLHWVVFSILEFFINRLSVQFGSIFFLKTGFSSSPEPETNHLKLVYGSWSSVLNMNRTSTKPVYIGSVLVPLISNFSFF